MNEEQEILTTTDRQNNGPVEYVRQLQRIADFLTLKKKLRWGGIGGVFFGGLILLGFFLRLGDVPEFTLVDIITVILGGLLFFKGWRLLKNPRPSDLVFEGALLLVVALFDIIWMGLAMPAGTVEDPAPIFPVVQVVWGIVLIGQYKRFKHASAAGADKELLSELKRVIKKVVKANPKKDDRIVAFSSKSLVFERKWKGRLLGQYGIFAEKKGVDTLFVPIAEAMIEPLGKVRPRKKIKVRMTLGAKSFTAKMREQLYQRFVEWKNPVSPQECPIDITAD
jgi:hypothetical protein